VRLRTRWHRLVDRVTDIYVGFTLFTPSERDVPFIERYNRRS
jgi:hypothetical protein